MVGRRGFWAHGNTRAIASVVKGDNELRRNLALPFFEKRLLTEILISENTAFICAQSSVVEGQTAGSIWRVPSFPVISYMWGLWALSRLSEVGSLRVCGSLQRHPPEQPQALWHFQAIFIKVQLYPKAAKPLRFFSLSLF